MPVLFADWLYGSVQVVRKPEEGDYIGHLRAEALMEMARIFQVFTELPLDTYCLYSIDTPATFPAV